MIRRLFTFLSALSLLLCVAYPFSVETVVLSSNPVRPVPPGFVGTHYAVRVLGWQSVWQASPPWIIRLAGVSLNLDHLACAALAVLPCVWVLSRASSSVRRLARLWSGFCPACGYDLRASPDRCPECGAVPAAVPSKVTEG
jgi:hypothetical protein